MVNNLTMHFWFPRMARHGYLQAAAPMVILSTGARGIYLSIYLGAADELVLSQLLVLDSTTPSHWIDRTSKSFYWH